MRPATLIRFSLALTVVTVAGLPATSQAQTTFGRLEALGWQIEDAPIPAPLVIAQNNQQILLGNENIVLPFQYGSRVTIGTWFDESDTIGVEGSFFYIARNWVNREFIDDTGARRFGLPYIDATNGSWSAYSLFTPSIATPDRIVFNPDNETTTLIPGIQIPGNGGQAQFATRIGILGADGNGLLAIVVGGDRLELLGGVRYLRIAEDLVLKTSLPRTPPTTTDSLETRNNFYGAQAGARLVLDVGDFFAEICGKVAAGPMIQQSIVAGSFQTSAFDPARSAMATFPGGIYSQRSNIGTNTTTRFAVVSEAQTNVGVRFGAVSAFVGYSVLYVSSVARPGNQIDSTINPNQSEAILNSANPPGIGNGPVAPRRFVEATSLWTQGISLGIEVRF